MYRTACAPLLALALSSPALAGTWAEARIDVRFAADGNSVCETTFDDNHDGAISECEEDPWSWLGDCPLISADPVKDCTVTILDGWYLLAGMYVVVVPPAEEEAPPADDTCEGDLVIEVGYKTTLGGALKQATLEDACSLDVILSDGSYTSEYVIDRPVRFRAAKGAAPVVKGAVYVEGGGELHIDGVSVVTIR